MAKNGMLKTITQRFRRVRVEANPVVEIVDEAQKQAPDPCIKVSWKQETYFCGDKEFVHVCFKKAIYRKDPISRTFKRIEKGERTTDFYQKDGNLLE